MSALGMSACARATGLRIAETGCPCKHCAPGRTTDNTSVLNSDDERVHPCRVAVQHTIGTAAVHEYLPQPFRDDRWAHR